MSSDGNGETLAAPLRPLDDRQLTLAFQHGEKGAYQRIYDLHSPRVRNICRRMLINKDDAEEAAQESFLRVFTALGTFNGRYQLGAWVARIATNVCLDQLRARTRRPGSATHFNEEIESDFGAVADADPEALFIRRSEGSRVRKVLGQLPAMHRAAIVLRDFEGLSYGEIAVALGITEPQVKALLHRARCGFRRSWSTTGLAALLPWNLLGRLRRPEGLADASSAATSASHVVQAATPALQAAASCSTALQQCGQMLTERFATAVTAVLVGASIGSAFAASPPAPEKRQERVAITVSAPRAKVEAKVVRRKHEKPVRTTLAPQAQPAPAATAPPATEPTPPPDEVSPPEHQDPDDGESAPQEGESSPPPLMTQLGWDRGRAIPRTEATKHTISLDCTNQQLEQRVETLINDGAFPYPALLYVTVTKSVARLELTVFKDDHEHRYSAWGPEPSVTWSEDTLEITGEYGALYGYADPETSNLPASGRFTQKLTLDCPAHVVVTESVTLTTE